MNNPQYNKDLIGQIYEKYGEEIDALLEFLKMRYTVDVIPDEDFFKTAVRVYQKEAQLRTIEDVVREFRNSLKQSI